MLNHHCSKFCLSYQDCNRILSVLLLLYQQLLLIQQAYLYQFQQLCWCMLSLTEGNATTSITLTKEPDSILFSEVLNCTKSPTLIISSSSLLTLISSVATSYVAVSPFTRSNVISSLFVSSFNFVLLRVDVWYSSLYMVQFYRNKYRCNFFFHLGGISVEVFPFLKFFMWVLKNLLTIF